MVRWSALLEIHRGNDICNVMYVLLRSKIYYDAHNFAVFSG